MPKRPAAHSNMSKAHNRNRAPRLPRDISEQGLHIGQLVEAEVRKATPIGLVLTVDQIPAFLHRDYLAESGAEGLGQFKIGDRLKARISGYDTMRHQLLLTRRDQVAGAGHVTFAATLGSPPWSEHPADQSSQLAPGDKVQGRIINHTEDAIVVELATGDLGSIALKDYNRHHSASRTTGKSKDTIEFWIADAPRISTHIPLTLSPSWWMLAKELPVGGDVTGRVRSFSNDRGIHIDLGSITGWIPPHELSWSRAVRNASDLTAVGETIQVNVLSIDLNGEQALLSLRKASAGLQQWRALAENFRKGQSYQGTISYIVAASGMEIDLGALSGWLPASEYNSRKGGKRLRLGQRIPVVLRSFDYDHQRLRLGLARPQHDAILHNLKLGETYQCEVVQVAYTAVWVTHQGMRGVIPYDSLKASGLGQEPHERFSVGDTVDAMFRRYDEASEVGVFALDPRSEMEAKGVKIGQVGEGRIAGVYASHLLAEVNGLVGTVARSELSWHGEGQTTDGYAKGQNITVKVAGVNPALPYPLQMSVRQADPQSWLAQLGGLGVGDRVEARIASVRKWVVEVQVGSVVAYISRGDLPEHSGSSSREYRVGQPLHARVKAIDPELCYLGLSLRDEGESQASQLHRLIEGGETTTVEFKESLRPDPRSNEKTSGIHPKVLRTLAGFVNSGGGTLLVGIANDGTPVGFEPDRDTSIDDSLTALSNTVADMMQPNAWSFIDAEIVYLRSTPVLRLDCRPASQAVFLRGTKGSGYFHRTPATTREVPQEELWRFIRDFSPSQGQEEDDRSMEAHERDRTVEHSGT